MTNVYIRLMTYIAFGAAFGLSATGLATFDTATGSLDILPFNIWTAATAVASLAAPFAIFRRWGVK